MIVTSLSPQIKDKDRINVSIDGKYQFSLSIDQIVDLKVKVGREYEESELVILEKESQFGKLYIKALFHCLVRPRSEREVKEYLYRKTISTRCSNGDIRPGVSSEATSRVYERLVNKGYVDNRKFASYWVENRLVSKGMSRRKLIAELRLKGVDDDCIEQVLGETSRSDSDELQKIINKKRSRYLDERKLIAYLVRLGFKYDDIKQALVEIEK